MFFDNLTVYQLIAALAAFAGALGVLQFLRVHRRRVLVSSTRLWRQLAEREKPRVLWHRWRDALSYATLLLIGGLVLLAMAGPTLRSRADHRRTVVIVLDTGISMQTREASGVKRLDLARRQAEGVLSQLGPDDRVAVITAGVESRALLPLSSYRPVMLDALQKIKVSDTRADLPAAIDLARAVAGGQQNAEIALISDRANDETLRFAQSDRIRAIRVGARSDNTAITGLKITQPSVNDPQATAIVMVTNSSGNALRCPLFATLDGSEVARTMIDQPAGATGQHSLTFSAPSSGHVEITLAHDDALPEDNRIVAQIVRPRPIRALLKGSLAGAVGRALFIDRELRVSVGNVDDGSYDVIVVDDLPQGKPVKSSISTPTLFAVPRAGAMAHAVYGDHALTADPSHPIMSGFAFKDVTLHGFAPFADDTAHQPLAFASGKPVLIAGADPMTHQRYIEAGWRLSDEMTGFPQRPQFVAFIGRAVRWLVGYPKYRSVIAPIAERTTVEFSSGYAQDKQRAVDVTLTLPSGAIEKLGNVGEGFQFVPRQAGVHKFTNAHGETVYLSAIREGAEVANIKPSTPGLSRSSTRMASSPLPLWVYLSLAALLMLSIEWWGYLKRVTV